MTAGNSELQEQHEDLDKMSLHLPKAITLGRYYNNNIGKIWHRNGSYLKSTRFLGPYQSVDILQKGIQARVYWYSSTCRL